MAVVHTRTCIVCGNPFEVSGKAAGRARTCSQDCRDAKQRQHEQNYKERKLWENTYLGWDE